MKNLSKSRYTTFCQCPKELWLDVYHPELKEENTSAEARLEAGSEVGELAKQLFPDTVDITTTTTDGSLDLTAMIEKTQRCLNNGTQVIAEAAFAHDGCYCAVDLLRREGGGWAIYEVKSSSASESKRETPNSLRVYTQDIAYQRYVLEQCGLHITGTYLVRLNKDYHRGEELDVQQLFCIKDVAALVEEEYRKVPDNIARAKQVLQRDEEPKKTIGSHCKKPHDCPFFKHCVGDVPNPSVFDLYKLNFSEKCYHFHHGRVEMSSLHDAKLDKVQRIQIGQREHIDKEVVQAFLNKLSYPLYFLDFETFQAVVPQYPGTYPYQQIPFQYSLHYILEEGGELQHTEHLGEPGTDPRRALAEQLCKDIPVGVCSMAYNSSFEVRCLKELAAAYPDLAEHLLDIAKHMVDLLEPFADGGYYLPDMGGSFSIKSVLPALFPNDPELDYHNLEGSVHNGSEAMDIFPRMATMTDEEKQQARWSLLAYCKLDTLAMVKVWQKLKDTCQC